MDYEYNEDDYTFITSEKYVFRFLPGDEIIELSCGSNATIRYDLNKMSADYSRLKIHKKFLFFLRRRYGVILDIKY